MPEHPYAGRIQAVAHLSAARALIECAHEAMSEVGLGHIGFNLREATDVLDREADHMLSPCGVVNVLQTVEEIIASGKLIRPSGATSYIRDAPSTRVSVVTAIVDAATQDELRHA